MKTLYVTHTQRDPEIAADAVAAARWTSRHAATTVLVVPKGASAQYADCGADLVYDTEIAYGFEGYYGIWQALHDGVAFDQAVCFPDDLTFLSRGLDDWLNQRFYKESVDLLGVADRHYHGDSFMQMSALFSSWRLPHETWDKPPSSFTAHSAFLALSSKLARELFYRHLLVPPGYEKWPLPFGAYATWTCQLLMLRAALKGSMDRPVPPLYVNDGWGGAYNPAPGLVHSNVLVYWSLQHVAGYSESDARAWCRALREANP
jgi:hypothetical protein